jgi:flagellar hook-associated protein 3 FlgL
MRISTSYQYESSSAAIQQAKQTEVTLQQELSTGKRINQPSDDPYGLYQSLTLTSLKNTLSQYNSNLTYAKQFLDESSNALTGVNNMTGQAYQLAVQAANSTTSQDARWSSHPETASHT